MTLFKNKYRIETTRLSGWDYHNAGCYYVTICAKNRIHLFGEIEEDDINLSAAGKIAAQCWREIPVHHAGLALGEFVIMPNHIHGIIVLNLIDTVETLHATSLQQPSTSARMAAISPKAGSLGSVVRSYKSAVTRLAHLAGYEIAWQERYWDHIIRDNGEFARICEYILQNSSKWATDQENILGLWM